MSIYRLLHAALLQALKTVLPHLHEPEIAIKFKSTATVPHHSGGQWQSPSLFKIAARLKLNTLTLAHEICAIIQQEQHAYLQECFVTAPGFLNFKIYDEFLALQTIVAARPPQEGKILIDFGGANIAKPLHVGHIRSLLIGEALRRVYRHCGFHIVSDIHLGDWGSQIGIVITGIHAQHPELPFFQDKLTSYPVDCPLNMDELLSLYQAYKHVCVAESSLYYQAQQYIKLIQDQSHSGITALWRTILHLSCLLYTSDAADE